MTGFAGVTGYPAGYEEPRHAYRRDLAAPLHAARLRRAGAVAPPQAVRLTPRWKLVTPAGAGPQMATAVADFRRFMDFCMGTPIVATEVGDDRAPAGNRDLPAICLLLEPHQLCTPESYVLDVAGDLIQIRGADVTGLQYGLYELEERMADAGGPWLMPGAALREPWMETRILRSFYSPYYRDELMLDDDFYPPEYVNRLAHHRINGVWLHQKLRDLVPLRVFPEFGVGSQERLARLKALAERTARYGVRVFLYLNEPRCFPRDDPFWQAHPEVRGAPGSSVMDDWPETYAMCTSRPEVLEFLRDSSWRLFEEVPELGGVFLITASEHHTTCVSHARAVGDPPYDGVDCPRCRERRPSEVVVEAIGAIAEGVHAASPRAKVIAWNWSWEMLWGAEGEREIVEGLPEGVVFMLDFERGDHKLVRGKDLPIDEYSLSFVGPSARFLRGRAVACRAGVPVYAKLQFVNTHELANCPWLPLPGTVFDKFARLRDAGASGMVGCWIFGNYPGLITQMAGGLYAEPFSRDRHAALLRLAERRFGSAAATEVLNAWAAFERAWEVYPFFIPLIYNGPMVQGPAFPWFLEPIHRPIPPNWRDRQPPGDNMLHLIPDDDPVWLDETLGELLGRWAEGVRALERALGCIDAPTREQYREYGLARCIYAQMSSLRNVLRFSVEREVLLRSGDEATRRAVLARLQGYMRDEIANAEAVRPYVAADSRLGWHSECFDYQFTPETIDAKVAELRRLADDVIPQWLATGGGLAAPAPYAEPLADGHYERLRERLGDEALARGIYARA